MELGSECGIVGVNWSGVILLLDDEEEIGLGDARAVLIPCSWWLEMGFFSRTVGYLREVRVVKRVVVSVILHGVGLLWR
jgi:hypothetical protein